MAAKGTIKAELLDELLARKDPKIVFERDGLLDELKKALGERILNAGVQTHCHGAQAHLLGPKLLIFTQI